MKLALFGSRLRFSLRTLLLFVAVCAVSVWLAMFWLPLGRTYHAGLPLAFRVVDKETRLPIAAARVSIEPDWNHEGNCDVLCPGMETDSNGLGQLTEVVSLSYETGLLGRTVTYYCFDSLEVCVDAHGYREMIVPLSDYTGVCCDSRFFASPVIEIALERDDN